MREEKVEVVEEDKEEVTLTKEEEDVFAALLNRSIRGSRGRCRREDGGSS